MILIIGGAASGKRAFANKLGYAEKDIDDACIGTGQVLCNLQDLLHNTSIDDIALYKALDAYDVIICTELGSGIVPLSAEARQWRDRTGRVCSQIAEHAECVIRMVCGIPVALKGELPCD